MYSGRIWRAERFGQPTDVLRVEERVWRAPSPGRVLVRVNACGVGLPDLLMTLGQYALVREPPVEPGEEVAGEVVAVASGSAFKVGDRVMGATPFTEGLGGYSDYAYIRESKSLLIPDGMSDIEAAGFMIAFRTAHIALIDRVPLERGQTLAVLGASGSSGLVSHGLRPAVGTENYCGSVTVSNGYGAGWCNCVWCCLCWWEHTLGVCSGRPRSAYGAVSLWASLEVEGTVRLSAGIVDCCR